MVVAAFEVTVDTLMALRINASDVASLFDTISNSSSVPDVISATVFRYTQKDMPASFFDSKCLDKSIELGYGLQQPSAALHPAQSLYCALDASSADTEKLTREEVCACRAGYRSEAVYVRSEDSSVSNGAGYVQTLAIAATFGMSACLNVKSRTLSTIVLRANTLAILST